MSIDLNADVGEGFADNDKAILPLVSSANIACGGHAGDVGTMQASVALCHESGVAIGAHPSYPDRDGFGRREVEMTPEALRLSLGEQLRSLALVAESAGARVVHVKPHGALYNNAADDVGIATSIVEVVKDFDASVLLVGLTGSALLEAGRAVGLAVAAEGFADRAYEADGRLRSRSEDGAVHEDPRRVAMQAVSIARDGRVPLGDGRWLTVAADTICIHGDAPGAVANVMSVRAALAAAGIDVARLRPPR